MELSSEILNVMLIIGTILLGNFVSVRIMKVELGSLKEQLMNHEKQIRELYDRTRYVMSGNQIRQEIREEVTISHQDIKDLQATCLNIQAQLAQLQMQINLEIAKKTDLRDV